MYNKIIIAICLIGFLFSSCHKKQKPASKPKRDLELAHLKGKVKSVRDITLSVFENTPSHFEISYYNNAGNKVQDYDSMVNLDVTKMLYKYNINGNRIEDDSYTDGRFQGKVTREYNGEGYMEKQTYYDSTGKNQGKWSFTYDDNGNVAEEISYSPEGAVLVKWYHHYDELNHLKKDEGYKGDSLFHTTEYKMDAKGNMLEENHFDGKGKLFTRFTYSYDSAGNKLEDRDYSGMDTLDKQSTYKYDTHGNEISWVLDYFRPRTFHMEYATKYEYDSIGNWIKEIYDENGNLSSKVERQIEYYK